MHLSLWISFKKMLYKLKIWVYSGIEKENV